MNALVHRLVTWFLGLVAVSAPAADFTIRRERSSVSIRDRAIDGFPVRLLLWEAELSPGEHKPLVFGDVEEMGFGLRVATPLSCSGRRSAGSCSAGSAIAMAAPAAWA